jgi:hypothetical protein
MRWRAASDAATRPSHAPDRCPCTSTRITLEGSDAARPDPFNELFTLPQRDLVLHFFVNAHNTAKTLPETAPAGAIEVLK